MIVLQLRCNAMIPFLFWLEVDRHVIQISVSLAETLRFDNGDLTPSKQATAHVSDVTLALSKVCANFSEWVLPSGENGKK